MVEIKNCPFCGSDRVEAVEKKSRGADGRDKHSFYVKCHKCHARGPSFGCTGRNNATWRDFAVHGWNNAKLPVPAPSGV